MDGYANLRSDAKGALRQGRAKHLRRSKAALCAALAAAVLLGVPSITHAQTTTPAGVTILDDTRLTKTADLDFGSILAGDTGGTITVDPDDEIETDGSVVSLGGTAAAAFTLERQIGIDYLEYTAPTFSDTIDLVHESDPDQTMTVTNFTTDFNRTKQGQYFIRFGGQLFGPFQGTVPGYFNQTTYDFRVGGTLDVAADQMAGTYTGTFTVSVDYN